MSAFWKIFITIVSVLFFGWIALNIGDLEILSYLQCGMLATILIYLVYDRIDKDKNKNKKE